MTTSRGEVPLGFVVLKSGVSRPPDEIEREVVGRVRKHIGPVASLKTVLVVGRLPKTRSGKSLCSTMKKMADGSDWLMPATIDDPAILEELTRSCRRARSARSQTHKPQPPSLDQGI